MYLQLFCLAILYVAALALYRVFFHPLHIYPGPFLAAATDWYEVYYNIIKKGGLLIEIERLHKLHGPVIRVGPNTLHFNSRNAYHDIYTYGSTLTKEPGLYHNMMTSFPEATFACCDFAHAKYRRGLLAPSFSRQAVISLEYTIQKKIDTLISLLEEHYNSPNSSVSLSVAYKALTTDIITSYCFAQSANTLETPDFSHVMLRNTQELIKGIWFPTHFPSLASFTMIAPDRLVSQLFPAFRGFLHMKKELERQIDHILKDPDTFNIAEHETIYHHLLEPKDPDSERPSRAMLIHEGASLIAAGSDTTGIVCNVGTFYALKEEIIHRKLIEELRQAWPDKDRPMSYAMLEKLPYLSAFIKESLRFANAIVHPLPRVVERTTPEIGGLKIPPGTIVEMSILFLHMNPETFPDPLTFKPERWLVEDTSKIMLDLAPFSKGPRICVGLNLAWSELYLIFANILRRLDMTLLVDDDTIEDFAPVAADYFVPHWQKGYRVFVEKVTQ